MNKVDPGFDECLGLVNLLLARERRGLMK